MANHDFVFLYSAELENWLRGEGCSVPSARPGNRYPSKEDVIAAVEAEGLIAIVDDDESIDVVPPPDAPAAVHQMTHVVKFVVCSGGELVENRPPRSRLVTIQCYDWDQLNIDEKETITMRGNFSLELFLVRRLTERCGQLVLLPDTGDPPVVVEPDDDIGRTARIWCEVVNAEGSSADFYNRIATPE